MLALIVLVSGLVYPLAVRGAGRRWPVGRSVWWWLGTAAAAGASAVPGDNFTAHMAEHILLGMAAPLGIMMSAPVTLALCLLRPAGRRRAGLLLASRPVGWLTHPVTVSLLVTVGMVVLYRTSLLEFAERHAIIHALVHAHLFASGALFAYAFAGADPRPHQVRWSVRAGALLAAMAAHAVIAKSLYAFPPAGVAAADAHLAAQLAWYGGDAVHLVILTMFWRRWSSATLVPGYGTG